MNTNGILGFPSTWSQQLGPYVMSPDYMFPSVRNGMRLTRKLIRRDIDTAMPITPNNPIARWKIPASGTTILDFRRGGVYITFSVAATAPGANPCPSNLAWNLIERFRLEQGGNYVVDQRYYGLQETLMYNMQTVLEQRETTASVLWGAGSVTLRKTRAGGYKYCLPFHSNAITKAVLPWFMMEKASKTVGVGGWATAAFQDVFMQWEFIKPESFVETDVPSPVTWTITRMEVEYEELQVEELAAFMMNWHTFNTKYPRLPFRTLYTILQDLSTAAEQYIPLDIKVSSLINIFCTFRYTADIENTTIRDKFEDYLGQADLPLIEYQWEVNNTVYPDKPVSMIDPAWVEAYKMMLNSLGKYHGRGLHENVTPILPSEYTQQRFILCFDGNVNPFAPNLLNPISTSKGNVQIKIRLKFNAPINPGIQMVVHTYHWKMWNMGSKGDVPLVEV